MFNQSSRKTGKSFGPGKHFWAASMFFVVGVLTACNTVSVEDVASVTITPKVANVSTPTPVLSARIDLAEDLYAREVQAGVFIITHAFPWPGNSMLVEMADGTLVLVDTLEVLHRILKNLLQFFR